MKTVCAHCLKEFEMPNNYYNRAMKNGMKVYCSKKHSGLGRRSGKTKTQKKKEKKEYDAKYRSANLDRIKANKRQYFQRDYGTNPEKYKRIRRKRRKEHAAYIKTPKYKKWKKEYDEKYRAKKEYGEYYESAPILFALESMIDWRQTRQDKDCHNKSKKRKRLCKSSTQ